MFIVETVGNKHPCRRLLKAGDELVAVNGLPCNMVLGVAEADPFDAKRSALQRVSQRVLPQVKELRPPSANVRASRWHQSENARPAGPRIGDAVPQGNPPLGGPLKPPSDTAACLASASSSTTASLLQILFNVFIDAVITWD